MFHNQRFTVVMFPVWALLHAVLALPTNAQSKAGEMVEPYSVYVSQSKSHTRSGPSGKDYRTDPLRHGQELKVYWELADGWLGVRPPNGSFSWLPASAIETDSPAPSVSEATMGTVIEDQTVVWVGTQLGRARKYGWQVRLSKGEAVAIIGRSEREGPDGPQLWYRIVPPAGEFRFVHRSQIVPTSEELVASVAKNSFEKIGKQVAFIEPGPTRPTASISPANGSDSHGNMADEPVSASRRIHADANAVVDSRSALPASNESLRRVKPLVQRNEGIRTSGNSVLETSPRADTVATVDRSVTHSQAAIGSGVAPDWQSQQTKPSAFPALPPSLAFLGRPQLRQLGSPEVSQVAQDHSDDAWIPGSPERLADARVPSRSAFTTQPLLPSRSAVRQVSGTGPLPVHNLNPASPSISPRAAFSAVAPAGFQVGVDRPTISPQRLSQLQAQVQGADVAAMQVILSQLMAAQSSSAEAQIVSDAARRLVNTLPPNQVQEARALTERAEQYVRLAMRRDGRSAVQTLATPTLPVSDFLGGSARANDVSGSFGAGPLNVVASSVGEPAGQNTSPVSNQPALASMTGQLVEVYSARPHSPPFALTDGTGRTIGYVTPSPGINLRMHLNQRITVVGQEGFVTGMNLPHVFARDAKRVASTGPSFR